SSSFGKCEPISPRARAPSNASVIACIKTSASECPSEPRSDSSLTPPMMSGRPGTSRWTSFPNPILCMNVLFLRLQQCLSNNKVIGDGYLYVAGAALNVSDLAADLFYKKTIVGDSLPKIGTKEGI